ncbi:MAG: hypothetical protein ACT4O3_04805 [Elusimicrobiota bacterium]
MQASMLIKALLGALIYCLIAMPASSYTAQDSKQLQQEKKNISTLSNETLFERLLENSQDFERQEIAGLIIDELVKRLADDALPVLSEIADAPTSFPYVKYKARFAIVLIKKRDPLKRLQEFDQLLASGDQYLGNEISSYLLQNPNDKNTEILLFKYKDKNLGAKRGYLILKQKNMTEQERVDFLMETLIKDVETEANIGPAYSQLFDLGRRRARSMTEEQPQNMIGKTALSTIMRIEKRRLPEDKRLRIIKNLSLLIRDLGDNESLGRLPAKAKELINQENQNGSTSPHKD